MSPSPCEAFAALIGQDGTTVAGGWVPPGSWSAMTFVMDSVSAKYPLAKTLRVPRSGQRCPGCLSGLVRACFFFFFWCLAGDNARIVTVIGVGGCKLLQTAAAAAAVIVLFWVGGTSRSSSPFLPSFMYNIGDQAGSSQRNITYSNYRQPGYKSCIRNSQVYCKSKDATNYARGLSDERFS